MKVLQNFRALRKKPTGTWACRCTDRLRLGSVFVKKARRGGKVSLKKRLQDRRIVTAPVVYDMVSLRIADTMGFEVLYMTGFGVAAAHLGLPDAGLASFADVESRVRLMAGGKTPLIADGDTGFGGLLNIRHTVRGFEKAGAAGIQIEDQEFPKKCGHTPGRRVIPMADMVKKIEVAVEARESSDFLIIARTDARSSLGLDEAMRRAGIIGRAVIQA